MASGVSEDLGQIVQLLVDEPRSVEIDLRDEGRSTHLGLRVGPEDLGKVIGRQGRTARALRTLLASRGSQNGRNYDLKVLDD